MSVSQEMDQSDTNLPRQSHPAAAEGEEPVVVEAPGKSLALLLDTVASTNKAFFRTVLKIVDGSPAWAPHLWPLVEAASACQVPAGPQRYRRAWDWLQDFEKLLAHPDQHPAEVVVCRDPMPLLHLCAIRLERTTEPDDRQPLEVVYRSLRRLAAVQRRAAKRRQLRAQDEPAAEEPEASTP